MQLTASQKRGLLALLALCVVLAALRLWWLGSAPPLEAGEVPTRDKAQAPLSIIDINAAGAAEFETLPGIGPVLAGRIVKYRTKIQGFASVDELRKVYGLDSALLEQLRPRLTVGPYAEKREKRSPLSASVKEDAAPPEVRKEGRVELPASQSKPTGGKKDLFPPLDLNLADSVALLAVPGIGPGTAGRIVNYRNRLGFYHHLDQLSEVWGLRPENLERMKGSLTVNGNIQSMPHIRLNAAEVSRLQRHPYAGYKVSRVVEAYVKEHGELHSLNECFAIKGVESAVWTKLAPYLQF